MWGPLAALALLTTINPVRLSLILLVLSRPRPMQNLLAYWLGALAVGLVSLLVPLVVLHTAPASAEFARGFAEPAANPALQRGVIGTGVVLLVLAAVLLTLAALRTPRRDAVAVGGAGGAHPTVVDGSSVPPFLRRLLNPDPGPPNGGDAAPRRRLLRLRDAWREGSPWIGFLIGVVFLPPLDGIFFALGIVVASGAPTQTQFAALVVFVLGVLAVEEIILAINQFAPARTQSALHRIHDWARAHHHKFAAAILTVVGVALIVRGMGGL